MIRASMFGVFDLDELAVPTTLGFCGASYGQKNPGDLFPPGGGLYFWPSLMQFEIRQSNGLLRFVLRSKDLGDLRAIGRIADSYSHPIQETGKKGGCS